MQFPTLKKDEDRPEKTLFMITTDGQENSSKRYSYDKVKKMVEHQKEKYSWEFIFLGANIDAIAEAGRFGINQEMAVNFNCDEVGISTSYMALSDVISCVRKVKRGRLNEVFWKNWKKDIEEDYKKRHK